MEVNHLFRNEFPEISKNGTSGVDDGLNCGSDSDIGDKKFAGMILNINFAPFPEVFGRPQGGQNIGKYRKVRGVAQPGSARVWGAWGRKFKSCHPDKSKNPCCKATGIWFFYRTTETFFCPGWEKPKTGVSEANDWDFLTLVYPPAVKDSPQVNLVTPTN